MRRYFPALLILSLMCAISGTYLPMLPETVASSHDFGGVPHTFVSKYVVLLLLPGIYLFLLTTLPPLMRVAASGEGENVDASVVAKVLNSTGVLLLSVHIGYLANVQSGISDPLIRWLSIGISLFLISLGFSMETFPQNKLIGIRTPWSLANKDNWQATHKFAAKLMVLTGALLLLMSLFARTSLIFAIASLLFAVTIPVFYSLWYHQNVEKRS